MRCLENWYAIRTYLRAISEKPCLEENWLIVDGWALWNWTP